ncbi:MAG: 6-phosphogluconolactonase [Candidatus Diapherotrites archaeon]|uniref:6-phosphogluconolactonase n=1 Tax=Candidatus Iainarchaeum sp. TaxID=3101447 RepID=A0A939CA60_9ARCH|nr:6-phosphogluconolactonase [Candidatus Diapherotrites archaeon]
MAGKRQLFSVGDICVDVLQEISSSIEFGEEHSLKQLNFSIGGNAANFAVIAGKLGLKPFLITAVGNDFATGFLKKELSKASVSSALIKSSRLNAFSIIAVNKRGQRAIQSVKNCLSDITSKKVERLLLPKIHQGDIVFFGGFYHLHNLRKGFLSLLKKIKKRNAIICFDTCFDTTDRWNINSFLPFIDYLFVNDIELKHIAHAKNMKEQVNTLFKKGTRVVAVKQEAKGATLFIKGLPPKRFPSVASSVVDTTAAGDAFNAGFAFGLLNNCSLGNCMRAANFTAAKKIQHHSLAAPSVNALTHFIAINNRPELIVEKNYDEMSKRPVQIVIQTLHHNPDACFALPTGATPKEMYRLLVSAYKSGKVSFSKARFFAIDEYVGLQQNDESSFSFFLRQNFFSKVNAKKKNTFLLNGSATNLRAVCARHEAAIRKNGIDLCILGIAPNGHIGFNEPGSCPYSVTRTVALRPATRKKNAKYFPGGKVPHKALTIGLRTMRENSAQIMLLASGKSKAKAVSASLHSKDFLKWPAVSLRPHKNFLFVVDKAAATK